MNNNREHKLYEELEIYEKDLKNQKQEIFQKIVLRALYGLRLPQPVKHCFKKVNLSKLPNYSEKVIGQILGKGGSHKSEFIKITNVNLEIDKETENCIVLSRYNSVDVTKAYMLISKLLQKSSWSAITMHTQYEIVCEEFVQECINLGSKTLTDYLGYEEFTPRLAEIVGLLKYSYSYNQNILDHCHEVAQLCANVASQISLDTVMAKRAGFFHDVGKSIANYEDHVKIGVEIGKSEKLDTYIINAIESHHGKVAATNPYSMIVKAMDKISAGRIAARPLQMELVEQRKNNIKNELSSIKWAEKIVLKNAGNLIQIFIRLKDFEYSKLQDMRDEIKATVRKMTETYEYNYEIELKLFYNESFFLKEKDETKKEIPGGSETIIGTTDEIQQTKSEETEK